MQRALAELLSSLCVHYDLCPLRTADLLSAGGPVSPTLHKVRVVEKSHTYIMYSPVAISDARRLAATPYRLFGARRPVARACHPPGSPPQRWSIHTGAVSRQCSSAGFSHSQELAQHLQLPTGRLLTQRVVLLCADSRP